MRFDQGLILAEQLANKNRIGSIHAALGRVLAEAGDWSGALLHYRVAGNEPEQSLCHEKLGDLWEALRLCPIADEARRLRLIERLEQQALETAGRGDVNAAMAALTNLRRLLIKEGTASGACLALQGILERHRAEVLRAGRQSLQKRLADAATPEPHPRRVAGALRLRRTGRGMGRGRPRPGENWAPRRPVASVTALGKGRTLRRSGPVARPSLRPAGGATSHGPAARGRR